MICAVTLFSAIVVDVVTKLAKDGVLSEVLYAGDSVLMSETIEGIKNKFIKWKESFESKDLKVELWKTKVMVSGGVANDGLSKGNVELMCGPQLES